MSTDVRFFVGVDWASETHQVCLVAADGKIIGERGVGAQIGSVSRFPSLSELRPTLRLPFPFSFVH